MRPIANRWNVSVAVAMMIASVQLANAAVVSWVVIGGGGAGGYGLNGGYSKTFAASGTASSLKGPRWISVFKSVTAAGGAGGANANVSPNPRSSANGVSSSYGSGGTAGLNKNSEPPNPGGDAPTASYGAGGGPAGGDRSSMFDSSGGAGSPGGKSTRQTGSTELAPGTVLTVTVGSGGIGAGGSATGGDGAGGYVRITVGDAVTEYTTSGTFTVPFPPTTTTTTLGSCTNGRDAAYPGYCEKNSVEANCKFPGMAHAKIYGQQWCAKTCSDRYPQYDYLCVFTTTVATTTVTTINACARNPCANSGRCTRRGNGFTCSCAAGWSGTTCTTNINECAPNPCSNGGRCTDRVNGYTCNCAAGWSGSTCATNINECSPNPCLNGGGCTDKVNGVTCNCAAGWSGSTCATNINECATNPCLNGGGCTDMVSDYVCTCIFGWIGRNCQLATTTVTQTTTTRTTTTRTTTTGTSTTATLTTRTATKTTATTTTIYDAGNVDCKETEDECTRACELASQRNYAVLVLQNKKGAKCVGPSDCQPGEGACPSTTTTSQTSATTTTSKSSTTTITTTTTTTITSTTIFDPGNVDCEETEDACTPACERASQRNYTVLAIQMKNGKRCVGPSDCQPGEGACPDNVDCNETEDACTPACERASQRNYAVLAIQKENGKQCVGPRDCQPGEGACPDNIDCSETEDACTPACERASQRNYAVLAMQKENGKQCIGPRDCRPGEGACQTPPSTTTAIPTATLPTNPTNTTNTSNLEEPDNSTSRNISTGLAVVICCLIILVLVGVVIILKMRSASADSANNSSINATLNTFRRSMKVRGVENPQYATATLGRGGGVENPQYATATLLRRQPVESISNAMYSGAMNTDAGGGASEYLQVSSSGSQEVSVASDAVIYSIPLESAPTGGGGDPVYSIPFEPAPAHTTARPVVSETRFNRLSARSNAEPTSSI